MEVIDKNATPGIAYVAIKHTDEYQPPESIRDFRALGRDVRLNGVRTTFYFGTGNNDTRVNFLFSGVWYHITRGNQPLDEQGNRLNLFPLLIDLNNNFDFVALA